jgi:hypothetical protein
MRIKLLFCALICLSLFTPLAGLCQKLEGLEGRWGGTLYIDSTKQLLHYEITITKNNDSLSGTALITFVTDTTVVVRVNNVTVVTKDGRVFFDHQYWTVTNNKIEAPKGVRIICSLAPERQQESQTLSGRFITTRTWEHKTTQKGLIRVQKINEGTKP